MESCNLIVVTSVVIVVVVRVVFVLRSFVPAPPRSPQRGTELEEMISPIPPRPPRRGLDGPGGMYLSLQRVDVSATWGRANIIIMIIIIIKTTEIINQPIIAR